MNKFYILTAMVIFGLYACDTTHDIDVNSEVIRNIKGTEIKIVAPDGYVPVCETAMSIWNTVNESMPEAMHLLTCFIKKGGWETVESLTIKDLYPMMSVAIQKSIINQSISKDQFSEILKGVNKPADESDIVMQNDSAYCFSVLSRRKSSMNNQVLEFDSISISCLTLVKDKYLLLMLEDVLPAARNLESVRQTARNWVTLIQSRN